MIELVECSINILTECAYITGNVLNLYYTEHFKDDFSIC